MGCFPVHWEGGKQELTKRKKAVRILNWTFRFIFPRSSKSSSTSASSGSSTDAAAIPKLQELRVFTLAELKVATKNFAQSEKIGEGGFGSVYKGVVKAKEEKIEVAVKKLNVKGQQGHKEWLSEVTYLRMVDHPNLVKLVGYCVEDDERGPQCLLVYEFMPNKSLDDHIFTKHGEVLSWEKRLQVALGTAKGLAYLHEEVKPHIIYRDLKASNILLSDDFNPKLSDFGLARDGPTMGHTHVTTAVVGTAGYAAPEYVQTGHLTAKSDVWSFGMVLLELLTGRKALDMNRPRSERSLADWAKPYANDSRKFRKVIDPRIKTQVPIDEAKSVMALAQRCIAKIPRSRPKMSEVVKQLMSMERLKPPNEGSMSVASITEISATGSDLTTFYESQDISSGFTTSGNAGRVTSSSDGFSQDIYVASKDHDEETIIYALEEDREDRKTVGEGVEGLNDGSVSQEKEQEAEASEDYKKLDVSEPGAEQDQLQDQVETDDLVEHAQVQGRESIHHEQVEAEAEARESENKLAVGYTDRDDPETKHDEVTPAETPHTEQQEQIAAASSDGVTGGYLDRDDRAAEIETTTSCSREESNAGEAETGIQVEQVDAAEQAGKVHQSLKSLFGGEVRIAD